MDKPKSWFITFLLASINLNANDALDQIAETIKEREGLSLSSAALSAEKDSLPNWMMPDITAQIGAGFAVNESSSQVGPLAILKAAWTLYDGGLTRSIEKRLAAEIILEQNLNKTRIIGRSSDILLLSLDLQLINLKRQAYKKTIADINQLQKSSSKLFKLGRAPISMKAAINAVLLEKEIDLNQLEIDQSNIEMQLISELGYIPEIGEIHAKVKIMKTGLEMDNLLESWKAHIEEEIEASVYGWQIYSEVRGGYGPRLDALNSLKPEAAVSMGIQFPLISKVNREAKSQALELRAKKKYTFIQGKIRALKLEISRLEKHYDRMVLQSERQRELIEQLNQVLKKTIADVKLGRTLPNSFVQLISQREREQVKLWKRQKQLQYMKAQIYWINDFF